MLNIEKSSLILILIIVVLIAGFVSLVTLGYTPGSVWHKAEDVKAGTFGNNVGQGNYNFPGNVGIKTPSPSSTLDVTGNIYATGQVTAGTIFHVGSSDLSSSELKVNNNSLVVTTTGNVGIGTTNPQAKLDVSGNVNVSGNIVAARPTTPDQLATKGYVDEVVATIAMPQDDYTFCYLTSAAGTVTCESGYTKILTTDGVGCQWVTALTDTAPAQGTLFRVGGQVCEWSFGFWTDWWDSITYENYEQLKLHCGVEAYVVRAKCIHDDDHYYNPTYASDVAMCCK